MIATILVLITGGVFGYGLGYLTALIVEDFYGPDRESSENEDSIQTPRK